MPACYADADRNSCQSLDLAIVLASDGLTTPGLFVSCKLLSFLIENFPRIFECLPLPKVSCVCIFVGLPCFMSKKKGSSITITKIRSFRAHSCLSEGHWVGVDGSPEEAQ